MTRQLSQFAPKPCIFSHTTPVRAVRVQLRRAQTQQKPSVEAVAAPDRRRVAQAPGRPEACREGQAAGGICSESCWWHMLSCQQTRVAGTSAPVRCAGAAQLLVEHAQLLVSTCPYLCIQLMNCVCARVPGFSEALETFYTVARDVN